MTGPTPHVSVDDIRSYWLAHATNTGFKSRTTGYSVHELTRVTDIRPVYISAGRYVADCHNVACNSAAACWIENPECCCLACGTVFQPDWPPQPQRLEAVAILELRPNPDHRNWGANPNRVSPDTGTRYESPAELKVENLVRADPVAA